MYLIYCDESGNTGRNLSDPQQPYHLLLALLVDETRWQAVHQAFVHLKHTILSAMGRSPDIELHSVNIFQGTGDFAGVPRTQRHGLLDDVLSLIPQHGLTLIWSAINKRNLASKYAYPDHPHDLAFLLVAERCQDFLENAPGEHSGLFIADESPGCQEMLKTSLRNYQRYGPSIGSGVPMQRLLDTVHFADSAESSFLQMTDACAYVTRRALVAGTLCTDPRYQMIASQVVLHRTFP